MTSCPFPDRSRSVWIEGLTASLRPLLLSLLPLFLLGCGDVRPDEGPRMIPGDVVTVVDGDDGALGPAAIVRVTSRWVIAVAAMREPNFETYLRWGSERVPARVQPIGEFLVLRAAHDASIAIVAAQLG